MYFNKTKTLSYLMIVAGILLIVLGLWQYMPKSFSSDTPESVFMSITTRRVIFPILGLLLSIIGYTLLRFVREVEDEVQLLRNEISLLSKKIEENTEKSREI